MKRNVFMRLVAIVLAAVICVEPPLSQAGTIKTDMDNNAIDGEVGLPDIDDIPAQESEATQDTEMNATEKSEGTKKREEESAKIDTSGTLGSYIGDVRLYQVGSGDATSAINRAKSEGYEIYCEGGTPVDLNETTERDSVYIGYKITEDEDKAIRSIKMLEMNHGYEWFDYQKIAEGQMEKLEPLVDDLKVAAAEFKENLSKGSRAAQYAKEYLNYLFFTDKSTSESMIGLGTVIQYKNDDPKYHLLGDYLSGGSIDESMMKKIIIQANGGSLTAMYSQLALAVSDIDTTWAERIENTKTYKEKIAGSSSHQTNDRLYYEYSLELLKVLRDFNAGYTRAKARDGGDDHEIAGIEFNSDDDTPTEDNAAEIIEHSADDAAGDVIYEAAYGMLNNYTVGDEKLGDYILSLGSAKYERRSDYRELYPLVESFTDGQFGMLKIVGLSQMALALHQSDELYAELDKQKAEVVKNIKAATKGSDKICVWEGVNTEFYERKVALSSDALRQTKASEVYTELTREGEFYDRMNLAIMGIGLVCSVSMLVTGCVYLGLLIAGSQLTVWAACAGIIGTGVFATIGGVIGCAMVVTGWLALAALVVAGIVYFVKWLVDKYSDDDKEDYTQMPTEIYDVDRVIVDGQKKMEFIKYLPVTNLAGTAQDLNANDGKRWNLLYYSRNTHFGSALTVDKAGQAFKRTVNDANTPLGYAPVTCFGESMAANLNSYVRKKDASSLYLHYVSKDLIEGRIYEENEIDENESSDQETGDSDNPELGKMVSIKDGVNTGYQVKMKKGEKYLSDIIVSTEKSESAAKAGITKHAGYKIYDKNLTKGNGYTYIGYASTTVKKDAIRDIRVIKNYSGESLMHGAASYASAGVLPDGSHLIYTKYESAGSPIIDSLYLTDSVLGKDSIYEPVNTFSIGRPYNLGEYNNTNIFLYFRPSVAYISGDDYIAGFKVLSGVVDGMVDPSEYLAEMYEMKQYDNWLVPTDMPSDEEIKKSLEQQYKEGELKFLMTSRGYNESHRFYSSKLCYDTTYNPYRAIYDVTMYTATPRMPKLPLSISTVDGNYTAVGNMIIADEGYFAAYDKDLAKIMTVDHTGLWGDVSIREVSSNAYIEKNICMLYQFAFNSKTSSNIEGNITWLDVDLRLQGLYQLGPVSDKMPLKESDVVVSTDKSIPSGMHSVKRVNNPGVTDSVDISFYTQIGRGTPVYMYLRGEDRAKGKYICGIDVVSYKRPEDTSKHTYTDDELKSAAKASDDTCIIGLCSRVSGEVLNYNIAIDQDYAWYNKASTESTEASYIGVSRTDDSSQAITNILMYKSDGTKPPARVKADGVEYRRTGDKFGDYYFYYTKSPAAGSGFPVEDITFEGSSVVDDAPPVQAITGVDEKGSAKKIENFKGFNGYFHLKTDMSNAIVCGVTTMKGWYSEVVREAANEGYNYVAKANLNERSRGEEMHLVCKLNSDDILDLDEEAILEATEDFEENWDGDDDFDFETEDFGDFHFDFDEIDIFDNVVRDVLCIKTDSPEETITTGGRAYHLASDLSLNDGSNGKSIYLYYSTDSSGSYLSPVTGFTFCSGDAVPDRDDDDADVYGKWEMLLDEHGNEANLNEGVVSWDYESKSESDSSSGDMFSAIMGHSTIRGNRGEEDSGYASVRDSRFFMFVKRYGEKVKSTAKIRRGQVTDKFTTGDLSVK
ncbi:MAG: hypothetical protein IJ807_00700 [Eubacterium sp.]|nr:hypothetical protein [Eubacterium sp.]